MLFRSIAQFLADPVKRAFALKLWDCISVAKEDFVIVPVAGVTDREFVFTGTFQDKRKTMINKVLSAGGTVRDVVSHKTNYVVVGDKPSSKIRIAEVLQIEMIDERTFLSLFEEKYETNFKQLENGLYVGYHAEGSETFELAGSVKLSMETLHDDRPLFLCHDRNIWSGDHLPEGRDRKSVV